MNPYEKFWMVYNPTHGAPTHRHQSKELAIGEAERLAKLHPGHEFHILESIGSAKAITVLWRGEIASDLSALF